MLTEKIRNQLIGMPDDVWPSYALLISSYEDGDDVHLMPRGCLVSWLKANDLTVLGRDVMTAKVPRSKVLALFVTEEGPAIRVLG